MTPQEKSRDVRQDLDAIEKSKIIFDALGLGPCWHEWRWHRSDAIACKKCSKVSLADGSSSNPNYFDPFLPDSERVKLVEAAHLRYSDKFDDAIRQGAGSFFGVSTTVALLPAATIAEAIYALIKEEK